MAFYTKYVGLTHPTLKKERSRVWKIKGIRKKGH